MLFFMLNCQITIKKRNLSIDNEELRKQKEYIDNEELRKQKEYT